MYELKLPEMGEGMTEATIGRWLKGVGDPIEAFEPLVEIETDKVTTEVVAEEAGVLQAILVNEGEVVPVGQTLAQIKSPSYSENSPPPVPVSMNESPVQPLPLSEKPVQAVNGAAINTVDPQYTRLTAAGRVSPVVARMAKTHALDLSQVEGSGRKGRITRRDVEALLDQQAAAPVQAPMPMPNGGPHPKETRSQPSLATSFTIEPLSSMRRSIADHMQRSVQGSPHATTIFEVDFSAVATHRQQHKAEFHQKGIKLTFTAYIMSAVAGALAQPHNRLVNSTWHADGIALYDEINLGMATATQDGAGLIVPVIHGGDQFNLAGMARRVNELAERGRRGGLSQADVKGGTFTVTNHGVSGSLFATPIINQPQCGILGVGAIVKRVVVESDRLGNDVMVIRPMAYLSFSFDHRILDGVSADRFVSDVKLALESWDER